MICEPTHDEKPNKVRWNADEQTQQRIMVSIDNVRKKNSNHSPNTAHPRAEENAERCWNEDLRPESHSENQQRKSRPQSPDARVNRSIHRGHNKSKRNRIVPGGHCVTPNQLT
jgi:hypothetical protein